MEKTQDYYQTDELPRAGYKIVILELVFFVTLCLGEFSFFGLPFSSTSIMLLFAFYSLWVRGLRWKDLGLEKPQSWWKTILYGFGAAALIVIAFIWVILPIATWLTGKAIDFSIFEELHGNLPLFIQNIFLVWIFAAFGEEMIFRGYLMNRFADFFGRAFVGWTVPLIISSVIFGAAHSYQGVTGMITSGTIGFLIGVLYLFSKRNLWSAIICHGLVDTTFFTLVYFTLDTKLFR